MAEGVEIGNIEIPLIKGDIGAKGDAGKISSLTITMLPSTDSPTVTNIGTEYNAKYVLGIPRGTGVSNASINVDDELVITLTDGTEINLGIVVGTSVSSATIDEEYNLIITLTDGTAINAGNLETEISNIVEDYLSNYYTKAETNSAISTATTTLGNFLLPIMARDIQLSINPTTYVLTASLQNTSAQVISTASIDLPLESMVVSGSYDSVNKKVILTLQSGSTVEFSVADLVDGLQSEITNANKLSADLVTDTNTTNKFVTASEKAQITANQTAITNIKNGTTIDSFGDVEDAISEIDNMIGDIDTALDAINGEVIS